MCRYIYIHIFFLLFFFNLTFSSFSFSPFPLSVLSPLSIKYQVELIYIHFQKARDFTLILRNTAEVFYFIHRRAFSGILWYTMHLNTINKMEFTFYIGELSKKETNISS